MSSSVESDKIFQWIQDLTNADSREEALLALSKKREVCTKYADIFLKTCHGMGFRFRVGRVNGRTSDGRNSDNQLSNAISYSVFMQTTSRS